MALVRDTSIFKSMPDRAELARAAVVAVWTWSFGTCFEL